MAGAGVVVDVEWTRCSPTGSGVVPRATLWPRAIVGLLETGAAANVLPYPVRVVPGADGDQQTTDRNMW